MKNNLLRTVFFESRHFYLAVFLLLLMGTTSFASEGKTKKTAKKEEAVAIENPAARITGKVVDDTGEGLPGVNIIIKGTSSGTITDIEGNYSLEANEGDVLVFSSVGLASKEITVGKSNEINVTLETDVKALSEIIVVGYGRQDKASVVGAIASVGAQEISDIPQPSIEGALQGRVAGVTVTNSGGPGQTPIVRVRGVGSVTGNPQPLYVIDGYPVGNLNSIDQRDIESVNVLKDASAAAIYGSRAANGVVIVTTKQGKASDGMKVEINTFHGVQSVANKLDLLNRDQYIQYVSNLFGNDPNFYPLRLRGTGSDTLMNLNVPIYEGQPGETVPTFLETETDWQDELFQDAYMTQNNINVSGGNEASTYYASLGHFKQDGVILGTNFERLNFRINSRHKISKIFSFGENIAISNEERRSEVESGGRTILQHTLRSIPYTPILNPTNSGGFGGAEAADGTDPENPIRIATQDRSSAAINRIFASGFVKAQFTDWLSYKFTAGVDFQAQRFDSYRPIYNTGRIANLTADASDARSNFTSRIFSNLLNFNKRFNDHTVDVTLVYEHQPSSSSSVSVGVEHLTNELQGIGGFDNHIASGGGSSSTTLNSYVGRLEYGFKDRYFLQATMRRDKSSVFAPGSNTANFPSIGLGWLITEEDFMSGVPFLNYLKLRGSWGKTGYNGIGPFSDQSTIAVGGAQAVIGGAPVSTARLDRLGNSDIEWEITTAINIGLDFGFLDDKFTLTAEYFNRNVDNMLFQRPAANSLGLTDNVNANIGELENSGLEFSLGYKKSEGDFKFRVNANIAFVDNEVVRLAGEGSELVGRSNAEFGNGPITRTIAGEQIQHFYGFVVDKLYQSQEEVDADNQATSDATEGETAFRQDAGTSAGDIRFKDLNGDNVINDEDREVIGNYLPDFSYGVTLGANYKDFDLTIFFQGSQGNDIYNGTKVLTEGMNRLFNASTNVLNAWTPTNTNTDIPRAIDTDPNQNTRVSDRFIEDGSYLRLKQLTLGYTLSENALSSIFNNKIRQFRVYFQASNLLTITNYSGFDPEIGNRVGFGRSIGVDYGAYPQARVLAFGAKIGL